MWWRFLTFCVLVIFILFVVLSCIHGRPVIHLFFRRCCDEDIENHQTIYENFGTNFFMRERLVAGLFNDTDEIEPNDDVVEMLAAMGDILNVHDPKSRVNIEDYENDSDVTSKEKENDVKAREFEDFSVRVVTKESSEQEITTEENRIKRLKLL